MPSVRHDSGFYCQLWRHHGRNAEYGSHVPSLVILTPNAPRKTARCLRVIVYVENLNVTLPRDFTAEKLFDVYRLNVPSSTTVVNGFNRLAKLGNVIAHGRDRATKSSTFHKREETPSAIAGVQRIVACVFTKL